MEKIDISFRKKTKRWLGLLTFCLMLFVGQMGFAQVLNESFDNTGLPSGWTQEHVSGTFDWSTVTANGNSTIFPRTGTRMAEFRNTTSGTKTKLITPSLDLTSLTTPVLTFYYANVNWAGDIDELRVFYRTNASGSWVQIGDNYINEKTSWEKVELILPNHSADYYIAFEATSNWARGLNLDDVTIEEAPSCLPPTGLIATVTSLTSANVSWEPLDNAVGYEYAVTTSATPPASGETIVGTSTSVSSLTADTTHYLHVRANCGGDGISVWSTSSFYTGYCTPTGTSNSYRITGVSTTGGFGSDISNLTNGTASGYNNYAATHNVSQYPGGEINYTVTVPDYTGIKIWIDLNKDFVFDNDTELVASHLTSPVGGQWTGSFIVPGDLSLGDYRIRIRSNYYTYTFEACGAAQFNYGEAEDYTLSVVAPPACVPPTGLTATNITHNSANLTWTSDGDTFDISWGAGSFAAEDGTIVPLANGATLSGLSPQTTYQFYVRQICGAEESVWAGPFGFTTLCAPEAAPTTMQTFDTFTSLTQPPCWSEATGTLSASTTLTGTTSSWLLKSNGFANADSSNGGPSINLYGTKNEWIISNPIDLGETAGEYQLRYKYAVTSYNGTGTQTTLGTHKVRVVVSTDGGTTWSDTNVIKTYTGAGSYSNTGENEMITLNYSGLVKIAFVVTTTSTSPDIDFHIDDFIIEEVPSCFPPTTLTATNFTSNSADLAWISDGTAFDIKWGAPGFDLETEGTLVEDFANGGTLSDLTPATAYQFYVRQDCGGELSVWAGPFSFSTVCEALNAPTEILFSNATATGVTVGYTAPETTPTGYTIFRSTSNIPPVLTNGTAYTTTGLVNSLTVEDRQYYLASGTTSLSASVYGLTANTQYYYYVYSRNCSGATVSYSATPLTGTMTTSSAAPTSVTVPIATVSFTTADVSWTAPAVGGEAGTYTYFLEVATDSGFTNQITGSPFDAGAATTYNLTGLAQGTFLYVRVRTYNGVSYSPYSTAVNFTTLLPGQVGSGTSTTSNFPIGSGTAYNYTQQIYTKTQIETNLEAGQNFITKIKFYYNGSSSSATPSSTAPATTNFENWTVYLGNTDKTAFNNTTDWVAVGDMQQSFSGTVTFPAPGNWMEIILDEPFQWDGDSNIVVAVDENSAGTFFTAYFRSFTSAADTGMYRRVANNIDPANPGAAAPVGTAAVRSNILSQIVFDAIETPSCMPVTGLATANITPYTVDLSWAGTESVFEVIYGTPGFDPESEGTLVDNIAENPYTLTGLTAETDYQFYVRQHCDESVSPWAGPVGFTTAIACHAPTGLSHTQLSVTSALLSWVSDGEDFEIKWGTSGFNMNTEGTLVGEIEETSYNLANLTSNTNYQFYVRRDCSSTEDGYSSWAGPYSFSVGYCASVPSSYDGSGINNVAVGTSSFTVSPISYYMYSTPIDIQAGTEVASAVTFVTGYAYHTNIWIDLNDNGIFESNELVFQGESTNANPTTYNTSFPLTASAPLGQRRMRIGTADSGQSTPNPCYSSTWGVTIDLIVNIIAPPSCFTPTALTAIATHNSAVLGWTSEGTTFDIKWGVSGFNFETEGTLVEGVSNNYNLSGVLTPNTNYQFYVRQNCGGGDLSDWTSAYSFTTECVATTVPYLLDFQSVTTPSLPSCTSIQNLGSGNNWQTASVNNYGFNSNVLRYTYNSNAANVWFYTQGIELEAGVNYVISYEYGNASSWAEKMKVAYGTAANSEAMTTILADHSDIQEGTKLTNELVFTPTSTGVYYFGFHAYSIANQFYLHVDNIRITTKGWTGELSTAWENTANWRGGLPTTTDDVIIKAGSTNYPIISDNVEVASITVESGASITVTGSLTTGDITVANGGNFVVSNGASLMQSEEAVNTGNISVHRNSNPMFRLDYTLWSSPVTGQNLQAFSPATLPTRIYKYDAVNDAYDNTYSETSFLAGQGYLFRSPNNWVINDGANTALEYQGEFTGVPNNGDVDVNVLNDAYNGLGNPYPSGIDATELFATNSGIQTIYFWTNSNAPVEGVYNANNWASWTTFGGTSADGSVVPNGEIAVGQGFIAQVNGGTSVTFNNDMRIGGAGMFFRAMQAQNHRFWINLATNGETSNQILIGYMAGATQDVDNQIDGEMFGYGENALYSLINNSDKQFVIQGRSLPFEVTDVVPLGFRATTAGEFTVSLANFDGLFAENQTIYLKDNVAQVTHDLKDSAYLFISEEGTFDTRFEVVYQTTMNVETPDLNHNWIAFKQGNQFQILTQGFDMKAVQVFDMLGRIVYASTAEGTTHSIDRIDANQVLIVKITTADGEVLTKKVQN